MGTFFFTVKTLGLNTLLIDVDFQFRIQRLEILLQAMKIQEHNRKYQRKREEKEIRERRERVKKAREAQEKARKVNK